MNALARRKGSLQREGIGGTLVNMGYGALSAPSQPVIDLLEGRYEQAGAGLPGMLSTGFGVVRGVRSGGYGAIGNTTTGRFYKVESGGIRGEMPLTLEQRAQAESYLSKFDMNGVTVRWVDDRNLNTAFGDMFGERILNIGSDVVPGNVGVGTLTANSRVSINGTLAHEIVGHMEAAMDRRTQDLLYLEEAQASIRAARFAPGLTRLSQLAPRTTAKCLI